MPPAYAVRNLQSVLLLSIYLLESIYVKFVGLRIIEKAPPDWLVPTMHLFLVGDGIWVLQGKGTSNNNIKSILEFCLLWELIEQWI